MNKCIQKTEIPERITKRKPTLIQKKKRKGTIPNNYRRITCLPMMWNILSAEIRAESYYLVLRRDLLHEEQKGCLKGIRVTGKILQIDQHILNEVKTRRKFCLLPGVSTKRFVIWSQKVGYYSVLKCIKYPMK